MIGALVLAIVIDSDRRWAIERRPSWLDAESGSGTGETVDDGGWLETALSPALPAPNWADFVHEQAEGFERYFPGQRKTYGDWSRLWRLSWWPNANPHKRWPTLARREPQPFFRRGTREFERAITLANFDEKCAWGHFGVAQFKPGDPRLARVLEETQ